MTLNLIKITDPSLGNESVTNDIENVLRKIEAYLGLAIALDRPKMRRRLDGLSTIK